MLEKLTGERKGKLEFIEKLTADAAEQSRDLSTNELELITRSKERIKAIDAQLDVLSIDVELSQEAQDRLAKIGGAATGSGTGSARTAPEYRSVGAYMRDIFVSRIGQRHEREEAADRLTRYDRAVAHITTGEFAGQFPNAIVGPVIDFINSSRPLVNALGPNGVPSGPTFRRPRLNDPNFATGVAEQANQKDELVSLPFTITSEDVALVTLGGY